MSKGRFGHNFLRPKKSFLDEMRKSGLQTPEEKRRPPLTRVWGRPFSSSVMCHINAFGRTNKMWSPCTSEASTYRRHHLHSAFVFVLHLHWEPLPRREGGIFHCIEIAVSNLWNSCVCPPRWEPSYHLLRDGTLCLGGARRSLSGGIAFCIHFFLNCSSWALARQPLCAYAGQFLYPHIRRRRDIHSFKTSLLFKWVKKHTTLLRWWCVGLGVKSFPCPCLHQMSLKSRTLHSVCT